MGNKQHTPMNVTGYYVHIERVEDYGLKQQFLVSFCIGSAPKTARYYLNTLGDYTALVADCDKWCEAGLGPSFGARKQYK